MELLDISVWARKNNQQLRTWFTAALSLAEIALCDMVALELLHTVPTRTLYRQLADSLRGVPWVQMETQDWERAREAQSLLAEQGNQLHRSVKNADLLIAAAAERVHLTLVHYDKDYDTIGAVTGQPTRWVAPRGSLEASAQPRG